MDKSMIRSQRILSHCISLVVLFVAAHAGALNNLKPINDLVGPTPFGAIQTEDQVAPVSANHASGSEQDTSKIATRFGELTIGANQELLYQGHALQPSIRGNRALEIGEPMRMGTSDVVLITNNGGTACPHLYHLVTVKKSGATATPSFGTCGAVVSVKRAGNSIEVAMRGYRGPLEAEASRKRAAGETHAFVLRDNLILQDGRPTR